jgi:nucleotide-binding universal stress UspA family protein
MKTKIVVGVDRSEHANRALQWCAAHAAAFDAEVVVVHVVETPGIGPSMGPYGTSSPPMTDDEVEEMRDLVGRDWCKVLADAGVNFRVIVREGRPAPMLIEVARTEGADLIVTGRRGRGGFAELLLGSTSHQLAHHIDRPFVIVP